MNVVEQSEVRVEVVQEMRSLAERGADVPELVAHVQQRLGLQESASILNVLIYFRAAFALSLREALPLREWIGLKDRSEVDSILVPAMERTKEQWQFRQLQSA